MLDFSEQGAGQAWSVSHLQDGALRFEVRDGDFPIVDGTPMTAREQAYVLFSESFTTPTTVAFDLTVDPGAPNTASYLSLACLIANLPGGTMGGSVFGLDLAGEQLSAYVVSVDADGVSSTHRVFSDVGAIERGATYAIEVTTAFNADGTGRLLLSIGGDVVADYAGPMGYVGQEGVSWFEGIQRSADATETIGVTFADTAFTTADITTDPSHLVLPDIPTIKLAEIDAAGDADEGFVARLTGRGTAGSTIEIFADGVLAGQALVDEDGNYAAAIGFQSPGLHMFTAVSIDALGAQSVTSYAARVLIGDVGDASVASRVPFALAFDHEVFEVESSRHAWSLQALDDDSLRFELRDGDRHAWDAEKWHSSERTEISTSLNPIANGTAMQVSYGLLIEPGAPNTAWWMVLGQLHQDRETDGPPASPPFSIGMIGERMTIDIRYGSTSDPQTQRLFLDSADITRGILHDMRIAVVFDPAGGGHLTVERDGVTLVDYTGPLGYLEQTGVYWAQGIYRSDNAAETIAVQYHDLDIVRGDATVFAPEGSLIAAPVLTLSSATLADDGIGVSVHLDGTALADGIVTILKNGVVVATVTADGDGRFSADLVSTGSGADGFTAYATAASGRNGIISAPTIVLATTAEALVGQLGKLSDIPGLKSIVVTDGNILHLSTPLELGYALGRDAAILGTIEGGLSLVYSVAVTGRDYDRQVTTYLQDGRMAEVERFTGDRLVYEDVIAADRSHVLSTWDANGSLSRNIYSDPNLRTASESFDANGRLLSTWKLDADGTQTTHSFSATTGIETRVVVLHADKSKTDSLFHIEGRSYATQTTSFDASGRTLSQERLTEGGVTVYLQVWNGDGSRIVHNYNATTGLETTSLFTAADGSRIVTQFGILDKPYAVEALHYDATNRASGFERFDASGVRLASEVWNADGSKLVYNLDKAGASTGSTLTAIDGSHVDTVFTSAGSGTIARIDSFSADGHLEKRQVFDLKQQIETIEVWSHDGIHSVRTFTDPTVIREASYDVEARLVSRSVLDLSGTLLSTTLYELDGSRLAKIYDADGILSERNVYADGTRTEIFHQIEGRGYTSQSITYNVSSQQVDLHRWNGDKLVTVQTRDADGSFTGLSTDKAGFQTLVHRDADGSTNTQFLDPAGALLRTQVSNLDGTREWHVFDAVSGVQTRYEIVNGDGTRETATLAIAGKAYATQHLFYDGDGRLTDIVRHYAASDGPVAQAMHYNGDGSSETISYRASGEITSHLVYAADGSREATTYTYGSESSSDPSSVRYEAWNSAGIKTVTDIASADGSHKITGHVTGLTVASHDGVADIFSLSGSDVFTFGPSSGHDVIRNFHAADGPLHDVIEIDTRVAASFSDLSLHAVGQDVVVTLSPSDTITLHHVALEDLTPDDFRFF